MSLRSVSRKAGGVVLLAAGIGLGFWLSLVLADILTFVWVYSSVNNVMEGYGVSEYLGKLIAVAFAALVGYFTHTVLLKVIKRDRKWVPMVAGVLAVWFVVMYLVSSPYTSGLFNPFDGRARAVYLRMPDGTIKSFPKRLKFDPDTGKKLKEFDSATAEEYQKQQGRKKTSFFGKSPSNPNQVASRFEEDNLVLWIEKIQVAPDKTVVYLACQGKDGKDARLRPVSNVYNFLWKGQGYDITIRGTYLVDDSGQTYDPSASSAVYDSTETNGWGPWEIFHPTRYVRVDEIYRFTLTFPPLRQGPSQLRLHLAYLEPALELDTALAKAEKIPPIAQVQSSSPVEAVLEPPVPAVSPPQPPRTTPQLPSPVAAAREPPEPAVPLPQTPSPVLPNPAPQPTILSLTASAPPVTHTGTWTRFGTTTQVGAPNSDLSVSNSAPSIRTVPAAIPNYDWMISESTEAVDIRVDLLKLDESRTALYLRARTKNRMDIEKQDNNKWSKNYLVDENGRVYKFRRASFGRIYRSTPDGTALYPNYRDFSGKSDTLRVGEVCLFTMVFDPLKEGVRELTFYIENYPPMNLSRQLQEFYSSLRK